MYIYNPQLFDHIIEGTGNVMKCHILEIGAWNMDTTESALVSIASFTAGNILNVTGIIYGDTGTAYYPLPCRYTNAASGEMEVWVKYWSESLHLITVTRRTGGYFDSASFDDAVMNRGLLYLWYIE